MLIDFYVNGKPIIPPPPQRQEQFEQVLERNQFIKEDVIKLDEKPKLHLIEIEGLSSMYLDRDPAFQQLLKYIKSWNAKVMSYRLGKLTNIPNATFYAQLYKSLAIILNEVTQTSNRQQQIEFTGKVTQWYYNQLNNSEKVQSIKMLENNVKELTQFKNKDVQQNAYKSPLEDFQEKFRSVHSYLEPPEDRIKDFKRKNLLSDKSTTMTRPGTSSNQIPEVVPLGKRPKTSNSTGYRMAEQLIRPRNNLQATRSQQTTRQTQRDEYYKRASPSTNQVQSPLKSENLNSDEDVEFVPLGKRTFLRDEDTYKIYEKPVDVQRLGEVKSTYLVHNPIGEDPDINVRLQKIYFQKKNNEVKDVREDEELIEHIQEWANNKGRVDEMIMQKTQTLQGASKFGNVGIKMAQIFTEPTRMSDDEDDRAYQNYLVVSSRKQESKLKRIIQSANTSGNKQAQKIDYECGSILYQVGPENTSYQEKVIGLEKQIKLDRFNSLKRLKGNWLPGGLTEQDIEESEVSRRKLMSTSSYSQKQNQSIGNRTFSGIYRKTNQQKIINQQLDEINQVKNRLAKIEKCVSSKTLQDSLIIPLGLINPNQVPLPDPGAGLFEVIQDSDIRKGKHGKQKKNRR